MEPNEAIYQLVIKYLNAETTENETQEVLQWINNSPENKELYFRIKDIADTVKSTTAPAQASPAVWDKILHQHRTEVNENGGSPRRSFRHYLKYAAAAILLPLAVLYIKYTQQTQYITIRVAKNQSSRQVLLPDHSSIWLKPGSSIRYAVEFNETERLIDLRGDGFFEVAKVLDNQGHRKPFTIQTSKLHIRVLGTSFTVIDQPAEHGVMVKTGVVQVESKNQVKTLHPGDRVQLKENQLLTDHVNADLYMGWTTGEYKFNNTTIREIKELLQANYNCPVEVLQAEKFNNTRVSGRVTAPDQTVLLNTLGAMLPATITKHNNTITIKPLSP